MFKRRLLTLAVILLLVIAVPMISFWFGFTDLIYLKLALGSRSFSLSDWMGKDLSHNYLAIRPLRLAKVLWDTETRWPGESWLPKNFGPAEVLEWGKNPGLGVKGLHQQGVDGRGVNVAIVDARPLLTHREFSGKEIAYYPADNLDLEKMEVFEPLHGNLVASILAGDEVGVAPGCNLHYFETENWAGNDKAFEAGLRKVLEYNRKVGPAEQIRIVSISSGIHDDALWEEAEEQGVMVFTVGNLMAPLIISPYDDKDDPANWRVSSWYPISRNTGKIFVPESGRTVAGPYYDDHYIHTNVPGMSNCVPYLVGVATLGLQFDPTLTREQIIQYLKDTGTPYRNDGWIINPPAFIQLVREKAGLATKLAFTSGTPFWP